MNLQTHSVFLYLKKHQSLAIFVGILISSVILLYAFLGYTPKYAADAKVLVRESALTSKYLNTEDTISTTSSTLTNPILNNLNLLKTNDIAEGLWEYLKNKHPEALKEKNVANKDEWYDFFQDGSSYIKAKNVPGTDIIAITFSWSDPLIAKEGMQVILKSFQNASLKINQSEQNEKAEYLQSQANEIRQKLDLVRGDIMKFKQSHQTVNIEKETENYSKSRIEFDTALKVAQADASAKRSEMSNYQSVLGMTPKQALQGTAMGGDPTSAKLYDQLYTLKEQKAQFKGRFTDKHPQMRQLNSQISQLEKDITEQQKRNLGYVPSASQRPVVIGDESRFGAVKNLVQANSEASALAQKAGMLNGYLHQLDARMKALPQIEAALAKYRDEEAVLSQSLAMMEQKVLEAKIRSSQSLSNIFIVDPPRQPKSPSFPTQLHMIILGILAGAVSGVAAVLLKMKLEELLGREILVPVPTFGKIRPFNATASVRMGTEKVGKDKKNASKPNDKPGKSGKQLSRMSAFGVPR
ncbi:MAG: hypothetical protein VKJ04_12205 [Vampirovibrionales bacterium]|nr:hypothetical protein [Vampirovibrionales bacterium]